MEISNRKNENYFNQRLLIPSITLSILILSAAMGGQFEKQKIPVADSNSAISHVKTPQIDSLLASLKSGKPTLAFFYYSVACSCTAARCAIAESAIDSIPELKSANDSINFVKIDAYREEAAEKMFKVPIIPAVVFFDKNGVELNRLEWGTNVEAIKTLIKHPEIKQRPVD